MQGSNPVKPQVTKEQQIVLDNLRLTKIGRGYCNRLIFYINQDYADVNQELLLGLIRAVKKWNPARCALSTYAFYWMRSNIQRMRYTDTSLPYEKFKKMMMWFLKLCKKN